VLLGRWQRSSLCATIESPPVDRTPRTSSAASCGAPRTGYSKLVVGQLVDRHRRVDGFRDERRDGTADDPLANKPAGAGEFLASIVPHELKPVAA